MIFKFLLGAIFMAGVFSIIWKILDNKPKKSSGPPGFISKLFSNKIFKLVISSIITSFLIILTFRYVKVLPMLEKVGILTFDFIVIYILYNYLFNNKKN
jgi:hypothetical protein